MQQAARRATPGWRRALPVVLVAAAVTAVSAGTTQAGPSQAGPKFTEGAFDVSKPLRELAKQPAGGTLPSATGKDTDSEPAVLAGGTNALFSPLASLTGSAGQPVNAQVAASAILDRELRGPEQSGQLQRPRVSRQSAGSHRGRRTQSLRRDDQPRLRRLLEDGDTPARSGEPRLALGGFLGARLH